MCATSQPSYDKLLVSNIVSNLSSDLLLLPKDKSNKVFEFVIGKALTDFELLRSYSMNVLCQTMDTCRGRRYEDNLLADNDSMPEK
jgi:hypothetical protein